MNNKIYSPETCTFVAAVVNSFVTERGACRGDWPIGCYWNKKVGKFHARCCNPFTGEQEHLGLFTSPIEAHEAWLARKLELAKLLAAEQDDPRVAIALVGRYENFNK